MIDTRPMDTAVHHSPMKMIEPFRLISIQIDSSCDDEEEGHVPSEFWFDIYCREK